MSELGYFGCAQYKFLGLEDYKIFIVRVVSEVRG